MSKTVPYRVFRTGFLPIDSSDIKDKAWIVFGATPLIPMKVSKFSGTLSYSLVNIRYTEESMKKFVLESAETFILSVYL